MKLHGSRKNQIKPIPSKAITQRTLSATRRWQAVNRSVRTDDERLFFRALQCLLAFCVICFGLVSCAAAMANDVVALTIIAALSMVICGACAIALFLVA